jgi:hypothetical protein
VKPARKHTYRVGRDLNMTSFLGKLTTPVPHEAMVAYSVTGISEYLAAVFTTADYFLGGNALNMTWVTGLGQLVSLSAEAIARNEWIQRVDFFVNRRLIGRATSAPFTCDWRPEVQGDFKVRAQAFDNRGAKATSTIVQITVKPAEDSVMDKINSP